MALCSGTLTLFKIGYEATSGLCDLFTHSHEIIQTSGDLYIEGHELFAVSGNLVIAGQDRIDTSGDLFIQGHESSVISGSLFTIGSQQIITSGDLFIWGHEGIAMSGDLFIDGHIDISGIPAPSFFIHGRSPISEIPLRIIHRLTRTGDYNPQLIGSFDPGLSSVNIQVWDVVDGVNVPVAIASSGCYEIGNTGKWRWSTEHLPFASGYQNYHYYFKMISHTKDTYYGEFFLTVPERGRWVHP